MNEIVVGTDGSDGSRRAVEWAAGESAMRDCPLVIVAAWEIPVLIDGSAPVWGATDWWDALREDAEELGATIAAECAPGLDPEVRVIEGPAARVLVDVAQDADLLVVGSRGRGGFSSLLLGSVSSQCAHHAPCPVVIVPESAGQP
ncbi:MAG: universal stress protein [Acidimicrobiia bacterium]|nr:universal stress protein [Acidimicrobiia bacterium]